MKVSTERPTGALRYVRRAVGPSIDRVLQQEWMVRTGESAEEFSRLEWRDVSIVLQGEEGEP